MNFNKTSGFSLLFVVVFLFGAFFGYNQKPDSFFVQTVFSKENENITAKEDFEIFWTAWRKLDEKFADSNKISTKEKIYGSIKGLASSFKDPYTEFLDPKDYEILEEGLRGDLFGIGIELDMKDGLPIIIAPLEGSPAEKAGILPGDVIFKIDEMITENMNLDEIVSRIRGKEGTNVTLLVANKKDIKPREITITRSIIKIPSIKTEEKEGVFVLHIFNFYDNSYSDFEKSILKFKNSKTDKIILDLRGNPGGYLDFAIKMASWFIQEGDIVVREKFGGTKEETIHRSYGYVSNLNKKAQIAILVNESSASASEILAGALREQSGAKIFGEKTYGKGSVQEVVPMPNKTALKITVAKWLTPKGISISEKGLEPDEKIEDKNETEEDEVLESAIKYLNK